MSLTPTSIGRLAQMHGSVPDKDLQVVRPWKPPLPLQRCTKVLKDG